MMYLGSINLYYFVYATFWDGLAKLGLARPLQRRNEPKRIMQEMTRMQEAQRQKMKCANGFYKDRKHAIEGAVDGGCHI